jgi:peptidyl-tRNA hydrolase, PTH2 family
MSVKQVIIIRKDLKMRRGKEIAQGAHAAMAWLCKRFLKAESLAAGKQDCPFIDWLDKTVSPAEREWLTGLFTKVTLQVNSLEELNSVVEKAKQAGLQVEVITDSGLTEFNGVPTVTCAAIGPDYSSRIDQITSNLNLY